MLNNVVLIGRLTKDPELRYTPGGKAVVQFRLAVPHTSEDTDFIDVIAWERQAENVANYLQKGRLVAVQGRLSARNFEDNLGNKREKVEVVAAVVRFLDRGDAGAGNGGSPAASSNPLAGLGGL